MGRYVSFHFLKNPKFKSQFKVLNDYISKEYSDYLESLPKKYYNEEENHYASDSFNLSFNEYDGVGRISSGAKVYSEYPEFVDYIVRFWESICRIYFYEEVALFDISDYWDEGSIYYFHRGKSEFLYGVDLGFIKGYCRLAIKGYNEPLKLNIEGIDKDKISKKIKTKEQRLKNEGSFADDKKDIETLKKDMLLKAKNYLNKGKSVKNLIVCGEGGVGKTTFIFRYILNKFYPDMLLECADFFLKNISRDNEEIGLFIWDVMGQARARFLVEFFANNIDGALFCFDLTRPITLERVEEWIKIIRKSNPDIPIIFLGMKTDLVDKVAVDDEHALLFKDEFKFFDYLIVSNATGENVEEAFNRTIDKIKQTPTLEVANIESIKKKFKLLEYLKTYKVQGKEELQVYFKDIYNDGLLEEVYPVTHLLLFPEFIDKIKRYINKL
jgi:Ras-related protein Rab-1A